MHKLIILHSNDIHGQVEGLARIATLVAQVRAENSRVPVLYFDIGDIEDPLNPVSNATKGAGMHRLLSLVGCDAYVVGNQFAWYGPGVLVEHAAAATYPMLAANLLQPDGQHIPGTQPTTLFNLGFMTLGVVGITADPPDYEAFFSLRLPDPAAVVRDYAGRLRADGADAVIALSHMGYYGVWERHKDQDIAAQVADLVPVIIGGHSHDVLPEGRWQDGVLLAQAGSYGSHLGRLDLTWDGARLTVEAVRLLTITNDIEPAGRIMAAYADAEVAQDAYMAAVVGTLAEPLTFDPQGESSAANLVADILRAHFDADVGLVLAGGACANGLEAGPALRDELWQAFPAAGLFPGVVTLTGAQLSALVVRGLDPDLAARSPRTLRGRAFGLLHVSDEAVWRDGTLWIAGEPVAADRKYRVAGSAIEFDPQWEYADPAWASAVQYDAARMLRKVIVDYIAACSPLSAPDVGRLG